MRLTMTSDAMYGNIYGIVHRQKLPTDVCSPMLHY